MFPIGIEMLNFDSCFVIKPKPFSFLTHFSYCDKFRIWMSMQKKINEYSKGNISHTNLLVFDVQNVMNIFEFVLGETVGNGGSIRILPICVCTFVFRSIL